MGRVRDSVRRFGPTFVLATAAGIAAVCAGRHYAEQQMAAELQSQARSRGVEVAWEQFHLGWDAALRIDEFRAFDPGGNRAEIEQVRVDWTLKSAVRGQALPASVLLTRPAVVVTKPVLPGNIAPEEPAVVAVRHALSSLGEGPEPLWPARKVALYILDGKVAVEGLPGPVPSVRLEAIGARAQLEGRQTETVWSG